MNDPGLSQIAGSSQISDDLPELSTLPTQDLPTAVRENAAPLAGSASSKPPSRQWTALFLGLAAVALTGLPLWLWLRAQSSPSAAPVTAAASSPTSSADPQAVASPAPLLGHLPYAEAPTAELVPLSSGGGIMLRKAAAKKFEEMLSAAAADGIVLHAISGFRSVAEQNKLFFEVKAERGEGASQRAAVSAPPGHSEHHTGYAIDIGDGDAPSADLEFTFDQTKAFKWLKENAAYYSFELSFPKGNPRGVSYEPWHWRFVGDRQSLETFYQDREGNVPASPASEASPNPVPAPDADRSGADSSGADRSGVDSSGLVKPQN